IAEHAVERSAVCTVHLLYNTTSCLSLFAFRISPIANRESRRANGEQRPMRLREINLGCFGGGTGLPSLLGGLKRNPWLHVNAVVTMFDSGGSSGQLKDELGVLPPGDVLR